MWHVSDGVGSEDHHRALLDTRAVSNVGRISVSRVHSLGAEAFIGN